MRDNFNVMHRPDGHARVRLPFSFPFFSSSPRFSPLPPPSPFPTSLLPVCIRIRPSVRPSPSLHPAGGAGCARDGAVGFVSPPARRQRARVPLSVSLAAAGSCYVALIFIFFSIFVGPSLMGGEGEASAGDSAANALVASGVRSSGEPEG